MRILHLICTDGISGAEKHLKYLLPGMAAYGHECHLIIVHPGSSKDLLVVFAADLNSKSVKTTLIKANNPLSYSVLKKINNYLKTNDIDIIHSHLSRSDILAVLLKQFFLKKLYIISTKHGYQESVLTNYDPTYYKKPCNWYYFVTKYCLSKIDNNISISNCLSQLFINFNFTKEFYKVIYHGVDVAVEENKLENFVNRGPKLIIVGRLEPYKGHKYVIDAMKVVLKTIDNAELYVLGEGSNKENLKAQAIENRIADRIHFLGFQKNALGYMSKSDLVIVPSLFEPFGLVFIEAMGLKKCVVAFDVPAGNEILNNKTGQLVPKHDVVILAEKIIELLLNNSKREIIQNEAYLYYLQNYTTAIMIRKTAEHYNTLSFP